MKTAIVTGATGAIGWAIAYNLLGYEIKAIRHTDLKGQAGEILICCHAAPIGSSLSETLTIDVQNTYDAVCELTPHMREIGFGRIVLFSSIRARQPRPGQINYAIAKSAIEGMTRALAVEYGPYGITVNCIAPGAVDTARTRANIAIGIVSETELIERTPNGRLGTVEEIVHTVQWLVGDRAAHVNGQVITVDGGWSVKG